MVDGTVDDDISDILILCCCIDMQTGLRSLAWSINVDNSFMMARRFGHTSFCFIFNVSQEICVGEILPPAWSMSCLLVFLF